jgi:hypothetical protein
VEGDELVESFGNQFQDGSAMFDEFKFVESDVVIAN